MEPYVYPGNDNRQYKPPSSNPRKYKSCTPARKGKSKWLEWSIFVLFAIDVLCQFLAKMVEAGFVFWWLGLGDDVLVFMLLMFLIAR